MGVVHDAYDFLADLHETKLEAGGRIGVAGFGLSAFDVVVRLTVGRGGTFSTNAADELRYQRSGREPHIWMFSRSGLPYRARPQADFGRFDYAPLIFDPDRIRSKRRPLSAKSCARSGWRRLRSKAQSRREVVIVLCGEDERHDVKRENSGTRTAIVTGCSRGIGAAIGSRLRHAGYEAVEIQRTSADMSLPIWGNGEARPTLGLGP